MHLDLLDKIDDQQINNAIPEWQAKGTTEPSEMVLMIKSWRELKDIMSTYVGIVRTDVRLKRALDRLWLLYKETEELYKSSILSPQLCEIRNLITIAYLITGAAKMRKESRGFYYNADYLVIISRHHIFFITEWQTSLCFINLSTYLIIFLHLIYVNLLPPHTKRTSWLRSV